MSSDAVSQSIIKLFDTERFYAEIVLQMKRVSNNSLWLAGVCVKQQVELHINHKNFDALVLEQRVAVLKHECEHILRDHIPRFKEIIPDAFGTNSGLVDDIIGGLKFKCANIAADCAINGGIKNLPEGGIHPRLFDLTDGNTMEWYLKELKDNEKMKDLTNFDGHSIWGESTDGKDILKEKIRQAVNEAAKRAKQAGKLTYDQELLVSKLNKSTVNWKEQLSKFAARSIECKADSSKKKRNRRYGIMYPGEVKTEELSLGVAVDTSGSVSNESLRQFMAEINKMAKYAKIHVVEADSEIKNSYIYNPKKTYSVKGRGGTAYQPAFDFFNKEPGIDAVIYFGDMDCFDTEAIKKPKYPVLWAIVGDQNPPVDFGSRIRITTKETF